MGAIVQRRAAFHQAYPCVLLLLTGSYWKTSLHSFHRGAIARGPTFYGFHIAMDNVHSETYSLLIEQHVRDPAGQEEVFNAIATMPAVPQCLAARENAQWAVQGMNNENSFAERLAI